MSDPISSYAATGLAFEFIGTCKLNPAKYEDGDTIVGFGCGVAELVPIFKAVKMMCSPHKATLLFPSLPFLNKLQTSATLLVFRLIRNCS